MATRPSWAADVDHDVAQAIYLHLLLSGRRPPNHADVLARAARTASAALFRGLMEFFHDVMSRAGKEQPERGADPNLPYYRALEKLTAESWRQS